MLTGPIWVSKPMNGLTTKEIWVNHQLTSKRNKKMDSAQIGKILTEKGLKVTPQRVAVLGYMRSTKDHPTSENVFAEVRKAFPNISLATIYNTLDLLVNHGLIKRVRTEGEILRYDAIHEPHHHLFCAETGQLHDYFDPFLDQLIKDYFQNHPIEGFDLNDFQLNINGIFNK